MESRLPINYGALKQDLVRVDGRISKIVAGPDQNGNFYEQRFTYENGVIASVSAWEKQP